MIKFTARGAAPETSLDLAERAGMLRLAADAPAPLAAAGASVAATVSDFTALLFQQANGTYSSITGMTNRPGYFSFSFETKLPDYQRAENGALEGTIEPFTPEEKDLARAAFAEFAAISGLQFFEVPAGQGDFKFIKADVNLVAPEGVGGYAGMPFGPQGQRGDSDVFVDNSKGASEWYQLYLHEIGHGLGLKHPFESGGGPLLDPSLMDWDHTIMSYESGGDAGGKLGTFDIQAIQFLYGDASRDGTQIASANWNDRTKTLSQYGFDTGETILGIGGSDVIYANAGNDTLYGREGNDELHGGEGDDKMYAGDGAFRDTLFGENGDDYVEVAVTTGARIAFDGGAGTDTLRMYLATSGAFSLASWVKANPLTSVEKIVLSAAYNDGKDRITGSALDETIFGNGGSDTIIGGAGNDTLVGGEGNDRVSGGVGNDFLQAEAGNDILKGDAGNDTILGGLGNDTLTGGDGDDTLQGDDGNDTATGGAGVDRLLGGAGTDTLDGGDGNDFLYGEGDADTLKGGLGDDYLDGGAGDDLVIGGAGADNAWGGDGVDTYSYAGETAGVTVTINQSRTVDGRTEFLTAFENLTGTAKADQLTGDGGANTLSGGAGNDRLIGLGGNDRLEGGDGDDVLTGGAGVDRLIGGAGKDVFAFDDGDSGAIKRLADTIVDFSRADGDKIDLSAIDAVERTVRDEKFTAIGTGAFHGVAGELRFVTTGAVTFVEGDTDGDKVADFALTVNGDKVLASDFVF